MTGLETDAAALRARLHAHDRFAARDISEWILEVVGPRAGERVLDLGCGTGKQALAFARRACAVVGLDVSAQALLQARGAADRESLAGLRLVEARMESLPEALAAEPPFHVALCCFALYYAESPGQTLLALKRALAPGGRAFVCGPGNRNNRAFVELCDSVVPRAEQVHRNPASMTFMEGHGLALFREAFASVELTTFENPVTFPSAEELLAYWRSYHLYSPGHEEAFRRAAEDHVAREGSFTTVKVVQGALLR